MNKDTYDFDVLVEKRNASIAKILRYIGNMLFWIVFTCGCNPAKDLLKGCLFAFGKQGDGSVCDGVFIQEKHGTICIGLLGI